DLIYQEIVLRTEGEKVPQLAEYVRRFPQFAVQLRDLFEIHQAIEGGQPEQPASTMPAHARTPPNTDHASAEPAGAEMPARIGRFQVRRRLGAGSFGAVYLAHDEE